MGCDDPEYLSAGSATIRWRLFGGYAVWRGNVQW